MIGWWGTTTSGQPTVWGMRQRLIAALVPALCAVMSVSSAQAAPLGGLNVVGIDPNTSVARIDNAIGAASALHAKIVRAEVPWSTLEPRAQGTIDPHALALVDRLVGDAAAGGIKVIATVDSTPCWDSSAPAGLLRTCTPARPTKANAWPPRDPAPYGTLTAFLAQRYGTKLAAIEVWNEPDQANQDYLAGPEKPQHYAAILHQAYPAIKQANPESQCWLARSWAPTGLPARALRGGHQGLLRRPRGALLQPRPGVRALHPRRADRKWRQQAPVAG